VGFFVYVCSVIHVLVFIEVSTFKQLESPSIKFGGFFICIRLSLFGKHPRLFVDGITLRKFV